MIVGLLHVTVPIYFITSLVVERFDCGQVVQLTPGQLPPPSFGQSPAQVALVSAPLHTVSPQLIEKLNQVPYFRQSIDENGYAVEQFNEIPSLLENETEFVGATKEMIQYVGSFL